jgi:hypothetical protein
MKWNSSILFFFLSTSICVAQVEKAEVKNIAKTEDLKDIINFQLTKDNANFVPLFSELNQTPIVSPFFVENELSLEQIKFIQSNNQFPLTSIDFSTPEESRYKKILNDAIHQSEMAIFHNSISLSRPEIQSVSPSEILIGGLVAMPEFIKPEINLLSSEWKNDPCNVSRKFFSDNIESKIESFFSSFDTSIADNISLEERKKLAKIAADFDRDCLVSFQELISNGTLDKTIESRVVIFTRFSQPFCSGVRLSKTQILTARHCFFDHESGRAHSFTTKILHQNVDPNLAVYILSSNNIPRTVIGFESGAYGLSTSEQAFSLTQDYIFVVLEDKNLKEPEIKLKFFNEDEELFKELVLVGFYMFHNPSWRFGLPNGVLNDWRNGLRVTKGSYCRVFDKSKNGACLVPVFVKLVVAIITLCTLNFDDFTFRV